MGHLVRISNNLVKFGEKDEQVWVEIYSAGWMLIPFVFHPLPSLLSPQLKLALDEDMQQRWNNFVNGPLAEMNKRNETNLVSIFIGSPVLQ